MNRAKLLAALAIIILAGIGIYVMFGGSGNLLTGNSATGTQACAGTVENAKSLDAHISGEIAALQVIDRAEYIGDLQFKDREGKQKKLSDWNGRPILLNLWATWCAPCRREMPALQELERKEGGDKFQVVPVSVDLGEPVKSLAFYEKTGLTDLPFFHDGTMGVFNESKKKSLALGMPSTLILDRNACVLAVMNGPAEWASDDAVRFVRALKGVK